MPLTCEPATAIAARVAAPHPFLCVNVWAHRTPTYEAHIHQMLDGLGPVSGDVVLMGDFNSSPVFKAHRQRHQALVQRLKDEFGLVSAYHLHHGVAIGEEPHPTHYWLRKQDRPFHIDFCFIPERWSPRLRSVEVGSFGAWADSDHRPLLVDVGL